MGSPASSPPDGARFSSTDETSTCGGTPPGWFGRVLDASLSDSRCYFSQDGPGSRRGVMRVAVRRMSRSGEDDSVTHYRRVTWLRHD